MNPVLPPNMHRAKDCVHLADGRCYRTLTATAWPHEVESGWLQQLYREPVDITLHYDPWPNDVAAEQIGKRHQAHKETLISEARKPKLKTHQQVGVEAAADGTLEVVRALVNNRTHMFRLSLYVRIAAPTHDEGDRIEARILALCRGKTLSLHHETVRLEEGYYGALPLGIDLLGSHRTFPTDYCATTMPFATGESVSDDRGVLFGESSKTGAAILVDRFPEVKRTIVNGHALYLGESGAGKSHAIALEVARTACDPGTEILILDVKGEYVGLTLALGGRVITDPDLELAEQYGNVVCYVVDPSLRAGPRLAQMRRYLELMWERCIWFRHRRHMVVIDEAWELLRMDPESAFQVWRLGKEGRSYNIALTTGTQDVTDISRGDAAGGENVLRNARTKMLFLHEGDALDDLAKAFRLSDGQQEYIATAQQGEALLIRGRNVTGIKVVASGREHQIVSSSLARTAESIAS